MWNSPSFAVERGGHAEGAQPQSSRAPSSSLRERAYIFFVVSAAESCFMVESIIMALSIAGAGAMAGAALSTAGVSSLAPQAATNMMAVARAKRFICVISGGGTLGGG